MKIVVLDGAVENPGDLSWEELGKLGELTVYERTSMTDEAEIAQRIGGASVVITNKTPITRGVLERCPSVRYISVLATGYNVIDCAAAREKGIPVSNVPAYGTDVVGQFAIASLLVGGASVQKANNRQAILGVILFHTMFIVAPLAGKELFGNSMIGEYFRVFVSYGVIAIALAMHAWKTIGRPMSARRNKPAAQAGGMRGEKL